MGRIKIRFPDGKPLYTASIPVRIGDINYGGHVGNDSVLSIIHEARMLLLKNWGYDELSAGGNSLIMGDVAIAYRGEAFYGDVLTVKLYAEEITIHSFDLLYHITTDRNDKTFDIAHAKTGMVCFDYENRLVASMTDTLKTKLKEIEK